MIVVTCVVISGGPNVIVASSLVTHIASENMSAFKRTDSNSLVTLCAHFRNVSSFSTMGGG